MDFIAKVVRVVPVVDRPLTGPVLLVEARVHGCQSHHRLRAIGVIKVRIFEELNAIRAQIVSYSWL